MGFELPDGKTARNIYEQVKFLTEKLADLYAIVNELNIKVVKVEELPEEGEPRTIYLVPVVSPDQDNYYDEYMWIDDAWEMIGKTKIDLSGYVTLNTAQTITGEKTFSSNILISGTVNCGTNSNKINDLYAKYFYPDFFAKNPTPLTNNAYDLGTSSYTWKDLYLSGTAYVPIISNSGGIGIRPSNLSYNSVLFSSSETKYYTNVNPGITNTYDLGSSSYAWKDLYLSGDAIFEGGSALKVGNSTSIQLLSYSFRTYSFGPIASGSYDIGYNNLKYKDIYFSGSLKDGTNSVTVADLAALITYAKAQGWIS